MSKAFYTIQSDFLQQGDIFCQEAVCPMPDTMKRIFRSADGRHGSVVFAEKADGRVFDVDELRGLLSSATRTDLHTDPFQCTSDGHPEMVVSSAHLASYFVIASHTCDISGKDKSSLPTTVVLRIRTTLDICRYEKLPWGSSGEKSTIEEFLASNSGDISLPSCENASEYSGKLREVLDNWNPPNGDLLQKKNRICNYITKCTSKKGWLFPLPANSDFKVPDGVVDFAVAHTIPTDLLNHLKTKRVARIEDPYRIQFAQAFATCFARVACPVPMTVPEFKPT